jgi:hypothetical protein
MAKTKQPTAKMGDTIDGDAVEKPAGQTTPPHASESKDSQTASPHKAPSSHAGSFIAFAALALSLFAVGLAGFAVWQQRQNTADMAALLPVANSGATDSVPGFSDLGLAKLDERLAALESQLAADRQSQKSALAALQDQMASPASPPASNRQNNDLDGDAKTDIAAIRNDMDQRFAALEAALASQALPANSSEDNAIGANASPAADTQPASSRQMTAQKGLLIASGLLADNLAGQPLDRWLSLLQGLADRGANITGLQPLQSAANPMPASPQHLLQKAYDLVPQMTAALNHAADNAGFLEKTGAKLGQLVQLREIGGSASGNAAALGHFETALAIRDLGGAINAAGQWSGPQLPSLDDWLAAARARQTLDKAVNELVTSYLATALNGQ